MIVLDHLSTILICLSSFKEEKFALAVFLCFSFLGHLNVPFQVGKGGFLPFHPFLIFFFCMMGCLTKDLSNPLGFFASFKQMLKLALKQLVDVSSKLLCWFQFQKCLQFWTEWISFRHCVSENVGQTCCTRSALCSWMRCAPSSPSLASQESQRQPVTLHAKKRMGSRGCSMCCINWGVLHKGGLVWVPAVGWQDGCAEQCGGLPVLTSLHWKGSQEWDFCLPSLFPLFMTGKGNETTNTEENKLSLVFHSGRSIA